MGRHTKSNDDEKIDDKVTNKEPKNSINNLIIYIFFTFGFIVVFFSLISAVFPGLIISTIGDGEFLEPFEISSIGLPIIIVNIVSFTLLILHFKHKLPISIENGIKRIFEFDL